MNTMRSKWAIVCALVLLFSVGRVARSAPSNDNCANAKAVGNVTNLPFDTREATFDGPRHFVEGPNLWYCYTATCTGCVTVSLAGSSFDTAVAVYSGCGCYPAANKLIIGNDDYTRNITYSQVTFAVTAGLQYLIEVGGHSDNAKGQGFITITCDSQSSAPSNDNCINAQSVGNVTNMPFNTRCATFDGSGHCTTGPNLWYLYRAASTGEITIKLEGLDDFDSKLGVYLGSNCYPRWSDMVACNDDFGNSMDSQVTFNANAGNYFLIEVGGYDEDTVGMGLMTITPASPPPSNNDDCINAQAIGDVKNLAFDTRGKTFDGPGLCMNSPNIWYCYTASCTGNVTVSLLGSGYDTMLAVYTGCACNPTSSRMIACNDDVPPGHQSQIIFSATAGNKYLIEVGGYGSSTGQGILNVSCQPSTPPPSNNDNCANAQATGEVKDLAFDTRNRTFDGPGLCMTSPNIWFVYTPTCTGNTKVSLRGSSFDTMLAVYKGNNCNLTSSDMIACNDDAPGVYQSEIIFAATAGAKYLIEIGGYGSSTGQGILNITCESGPSVAKPDLGDAPDSTNNFARNMNAYPGVKANYPTVYNDGSNTGPFGPIHLNEQLVAYLGKTITAETEADKGTDEDGPKNINPTSGAANNDKGDDGVVTPLNLPTCRWTTFDYTVNVVDPDVDLYVNVWFDWNRDGDWDDTLDCAQGPAREWSVRNQLLFNLPVGLNKITSPAILPWHPKTGPKEIWMRITLSELPYKHGSNPGVKGNAGSGPQEKYLLGETEDYFFTPDTSYMICEDFNGDGKINTDDLVSFTSKWLEKCPD